MPSPWTKLDFKYRLSYQRADAKPIQILKPREATPHFYRVDVIYVIYTPTSRTLSSRHCLTLRKILNQDSLSVATDWMLQLSWTGLIQHNRNRNISITGRNCILFKAQHQYQILACADSLQGSQQIYMQLKALTIMLYLLLSGLKTIPRNFNAKMAELLL